MADIIVADITPRIQYTAGGGGPTVFSYPFAIFANTDLNVYYTPNGQAPNDATQELTYNVDYTVTNSVPPTVGGTITLTNPASVGDVITIVRNMPDSRLNNYINGGLFQATMVNTDFDRTVFMAQQNKMYDQVVGVHYNLSANPQSTRDTILPILGANQVWQMNSAGTAIIAANMGGGGGGGTVTSVSGTANQIVATGSTAVVLSLASNAIMPGAGGLTLPQGNTASRSGGAGTIRFNTQSLVFEAYDGVSWATLESSTTGVISVAGTTNRIAVSPTTGNVIVDISASYVGQSSITTVGTITNGTWNGATVGVLYGGTGLASTTINQLLYSSANNVIAGLATANNGVLITSAGGVPSIGSTLPTAVQGNITQLGAQSQALNMNSNLINNVSNPVSTQDAATKNYVDAISAGFTFRSSVVAASTGALTVTYNNGSSGVGATLTNAGAQATFALDGQSPTVNQRVLIKNQASSLQNGIYTVTNVGSNSTNWVLTRSTDFNSPSNINPGDLVPVTAGTTNADTLWFETATVNTVGTDAITFSQFSSAPLAIPVTVANGGTGDTSLTAYAVLCGGTTSTGAVQSIASVGTAGQVLTSNGPGALPTMQNAGGGSGGWVLLASRTASNSATIDFVNVFTSSYDVYFVELFGVIPVTDNRTLEMLFGFGGTPTYANTGYSWTQNATRSDNATITHGASTNTTYVNLSWVDAGNGPQAAGTGMSGSVWIYGANGTSGNLWGSSSMSMIEAIVAVMASNTGAFMQTTNQTWNSMRFLFDSGNISSGVFRVYGVKNS